MRTHHRRTAAAAPEALWERATEVRLDETRSLGRLVRWRIPGLARDLTYHELFRAYPFCVLEEDRPPARSRACAGGSGRSRATTRGSTGRTRSRAGTSPARCACCSRTGSAQAGDGRAELVSEARVEPVDARSALRLKALWAVIGRFERLVGAEPLELAARRAEGGASRLGGAVLEPGERGLRAQHDPPAPPQDDAHPAREVVLGAQ